MLEVNEAAHIRRKLGYENAARALPGSWPWADVGRGLVVVTECPRLRVGVRRRMVDGCHTGHVADNIQVSAAAGSDRCNRFGTYPMCPLCDGALHAEHAHFKCASCGWRDSCCD